MTLKEFRFINLTKMESCNGEFKDPLFIGDPLHPPYHPNCLCVGDLIFTDPDGDGGERMEPRRFMIIVYRRGINAVSK